MEVEDLLIGLSVLANKIITSIEQMHEVQMQCLDKIGNELEFIFQELEYINGTNSFEDQMKVELRGISVPVDTNPSRE